jgi:hypothetical protein
MIEAEIYLGKQFILAMYDVALPRKGDILWIESDDRLSELTGTPVGLTCELIVDNVLFVFGPPRTASQIMEIHVICSINPDPLK